jgi:hypothetical protein
MDPERIAAEHLVAFAHYWRRAYPDELLVGATLEEQGKSLARWVVDAFEQLYAIVAAAPAQ